jgi:hypothetical protein
MLSATTVPAKLIVLPPAWAKTEVASNENIMPSFDKLSVGIIGILHSWETLACCF